MQVRATALAGIQIIEPRVFHDDRGWLFESWSEQRYREAGIAASFVQTNHSHSKAGVVRGLHYQLGSGQSKLISVVRGRILDIAVDLRRGSPTFGQHIQEELSAENRRQVFIPAGFAHGFMALEDSDVLYMMSDVYRPELERGIAWHDPALGLPWPDSGGILSEKDRALPLLADMAPADLP
jgi:dTDP-4-dehydrorhamnose 3,5-epimerase